jgi:hypothetical protein
MNPGWEKRQLNHRLKLYLVIKYIVIVYSFIHDILVAEVVLYA